MYQQLPQGVDRFVVNLDIIGLEIPCRAFFIEFSLGDNVLKGHSKWLKRAAYALLRGQPWPSG